MVVIPAKGERLLDADGRWMCRHGHDKNVVGTANSGMCKVCYNRCKTKYRHKNGYKREGYRGDPKAIPNLKIIRLNLGLSQKQLSRLSGVSKTTISHVEKGTRNAGYTTRRKLLEVLAPMLAKRREVGIR